MEHSARFAKTANVNLNISDIDWVTFASLLMDREVKYKLYIILVVHLFCIPVDVVCYIKLQLFRVSQNNYKCISIRKSFPT